MASNNYDETDSCDTRKTNHKIHENIRNNCSSEPAQRKNKPGRMNSRECADSWKRRNRVWLRRKRDIIEPKGGSMFKVTRRSMFKFKAIFQVERGHMSEFKGGCIFEATRGSQFQVQRWKYHLGHAWIQKWRRSEPHPTQTTVWEASNDSHCESRMRAACNATASRRLLPRSCHAGMSTVRSASISWVRSADKPINYLAPHVKLPSAPFILHTTSSQWSPESCNSSRKTPTHQMRSSSILWRITWPSLPPLWLGWTWSHLTSTSSTKNKSICSSSTLWRIRQARASWIPPWPHFTSRRWIRKDWPPTNVWIVSTSWMLDSSSGGCPVWLGRSRPLRLERNCTESPFLRRTIGEFIKEHQVYL